MQFCNQRKNLVFLLTFLYAWQTKDYKELIILHDKVETQDQFVHYKVIKSQTYTAGCRKIAAVDSHNQDWD